MTGDVRRTDVLDRQAGGDDAIKDVEGRRVVAEMNVHEASLAREYPLSIWLKV